MTTPTTTISDQIYSSRDRIKNQIIEYMQTYLELENVDLTKTSFLSFMIEVLSTLTSNLMFYQSSTYNEFFLTKAQLPESIYNLSAFLGYSPSNANYAICNILMTIPFGFEDDDVTFIIPENFKFYANDIEFKTYYSTSINVISNSTSTVTVTEGTKTYDLPVTYDTDNNFYFVLPARQLQTIEQEFQIDSDLQLYQFVTIDVPISGKVSSLSVSLKDPDSTTIRTYEPYSSLYLMDETTYGYVSRRTDTGRKLYFGNGLIGAQPTPGSTILVTANVTEGADGNVISSAISSGDRIYNETLAGITQIVNYTPINTNPATGGSDEESLEEIRSNSIASITALGRLVSESDFENANVVIPNSPLAANSLPILKRSDIKGNEIQLFTTLTYGSDIVPTRNAKYETTSLEIPRQTTITIDSVDYYTLFDMSINVENDVAYYNYIMYAIEQTPTLITSYGSTYDITADNFTVSKSDDSAIFNLHYISTESDSDTTECTMQILETGAEYTMTNDSTASNFTYTFGNYTDIPENSQTYYFTISHGSSAIAQYTVVFTFRKSLDDFTMSNVTSDGTSYIVYDVPVVKGSYYDSIDKEVFEVNILQSMMETVTFGNYKMLTDFVNLKFGNTTGTMTNMQHNPVTLLPVTDIGCSPPDFPSLGDRYIVSEGSDAWIGHNNNIAQCTDATAVTWTFSTPHVDDIIYITSKAKKYIFSDMGWVDPEYTIPLQLEIEIFKTSTFTGSVSDLTASVKTAILAAFSSRFGIGITLYRSEIIDVIQGVTGVGYCRLVQPASSIYFDYDIDNFTQTDLLEYGPEYVYFTEDDITIRIY